MNENRRVPEVPDPAGAGSGRPGMAEAPVAGSAAGTVSGPMSSDTVDGRIPDDAAGKPGGIVTVKGRVASAPVAADMWFQDERAEATAGAVCVPVQVRSSGQIVDGNDWVASEVPVALVFNGISHAVMMATPADLEDFALGFALTEGLLHSPSELYGVDVNPVADGIEVQLEVASEAIWRLKERRRTLAGRTGCGLCGTDSLAQVHRQRLPEPFVVSVTAEAVLRAEAGLKAGQSIQRLTGATHAAGWCSLSGEVLQVREDVGRHNALDKLAGALVREGTDMASGFITITSRASFEMVQKAAMMRAGLLAAVSAPTALAIDTARDAGVALVGLVRSGQQRLVAYTLAERLVPADGS